MGSGRETQVWLRMGAQEGGAGQLLLVQCSAITGGVGEPALSPAKAEKALLIGHTKCLQPTQVGEPLLLSRSCHLE